MRQFIRMGWHQAGWTWDDFLDLSIYERFVAHDELADLIDRTNSAGGKLNKELKR